MEVGEGIVSAAIGYSVVRVVPPNAFQLAVTLWMDGWMDGWMEWEGKRETVITADCSST
jgi:hypothetical protein